jgi:hypothetical protein
MLIRHSVSSADEGDQAACAVVAPDHEDANEARRVNHEDEDGVRVPHGSEDHLDLVEEGDYDLYLPGSGGRI